MVGPLEAGGTAARRLIKRGGQQVTLESTTTSIDTDSDWDDETMETETLVVQGLVTRTRTAGKIAASETEARTKIDFVVWLEQSVEDRLTLTDYSGTSDPTKVTFSGTQYECVLVDRTVPGVVRLEVAR